jgi:hypothetical protein
MTEMEQDMENKRIIYSRASGGIGVIVPSNNAGMSLADIAAKDVPAGRPYRLVEVPDIPSDRSFRDAWESDFSNPDGGGAEHGAVADITP